MPDRGFFGKLFDFSFKTFVTTSIIPVLYVLVIALSALAALGTFLAFASQGAGAALFGLVLAPILFFVYILLGRVWMEVLIVVFRIAENTEEMARAVRDNRSLV